MFKFRAKKTPSGLSTVQATQYRHGNNDLIELRSVVKAYKTAAGEFTALRGVNLQVDRGEFVAVVGKSGSGKSTLINMITGIDRPSSGAVLVGDTAVHTLSEGQMAVWRGKHVGVIFQFFQLLPTLTVLENVMLPMDFCNSYPLRERPERAMALLEEVDMTEHADKLPAATSGGQQQRVAIARALANDPAIVVADEPTGNLDSRTAEAVFQLFQRLVDEGKTILMVTHDADLAHQAGRTVTIADGHIVGDTRKDLEAWEVGEEVDKETRKGVDKDMVHGVDWEPPRRDKEKLGGTGERPDTRVTGAVHSAQILGWR